MKNMKLEQTKKVDTVMTIFNVSGAPRLFRHIVIPRLPA
jgi:hypothetical protein